TAFITVVQFLAQLTRNHRVLFRQKNRQRAMIIPQRFIGRISVLQHPLHWKERQMRLSSGDQVVVRRDQKDSANSLAVLPRQITGRTGSKRFTNQKHGTRLLDAVECFVRGSQNTLLAGRPGTPTITRVLQDIEIRRVDLLETVSKMKPAERATGVSMSQ